MQKQKIGSQTNLKHLKLVAVKGLKIGYASSNILNNKRQFLHVSSVTREHGIKGFYGFYCGQCEHGQIIWSCLLCSIFNNHSVIWKKQGSNYHSLSTFA